MDISLWEQGLAFYSKSQFEEALACFTKVAKDNPKSANALFNKALCLFNLKRFDEAKKDLLSIYRFGRAKLSYIELLEDIATLQNDKREAMLWHERAEKLRHTYIQRREKTPKNIPVGNATRFDDDGKITQLAMFNSTTTFADVMGMKEIKSYLNRNVVLALQNPELYKKYKKKLTGGVLLYGSSGCGKTFIVKALAGETKANFIVVKISDVMQKYVGLSEQNVHTIFEVARQHKPCIIFFDEFDALGTKRASFGDTKGEGSALRSVINTLLTEIDGIESNPEGIFIIAGTNRLWDIDPAFCRQGRFSMSLYVRPPNFAERKEMFRFYLKDKMTKGMNYYQLAMLTAGYSPADIAGIVDSALLEPILYEKDTGKGRKLTMKDLVLTIRKFFPESSLKYWFLTARAEMIGKQIIEVVDGKVHTTFKSGNLEPEEQMRYKPLVKDVERQDSSWSVFVKNFQRSLGSIGLPS
jgi:ATP-dependent 26S proteasome regulatory subunit